MWRLWLITNKEIRKLIMYQIINDKLKFYSLIANVGLNILTITLPTFVRFSWAAIIFYYLWFCFRSRNCPTYLQIFCISYLYCMFVRIFLLYKIVSWHVVKHRTNSSVKQSTSKPRKNWNISHANGVNWFLSFSIYLA